MTQVASLFPYTRCHAWPLLSILPRWFQFDLKKQYHHHPCHQFSFDEKKIVSVVGRIRPNLSNYWNSKMKHAPVTLRQLLTFQFQYLAGLCLHAANAHRNISRHSRRPRLLTQKGNEASVEVHTRATHEPQILRMTLHFGSSSFPLLSGMLSSVSSFFRHHYFSLLYVWDNMERRPTRTFHWRRWASCRSPLT